MFILCSSLPSRLVAFPFWGGGTLRSGQGTGSMSEEKRKSGAVLWRVLGGWVHYPLCLISAKHTPSLWLCAEQTPHKLLCPVWPLRSDSHLWLSPQSIKHRKWHILSPAGQFEMQFAQSEQVRPGLIFDPFLVIFRLSWRSRCLPLVNVWGFVDVLA